MSLAAPIADAVLITGAGRRVGLHLAERMLDRQRPVIAHFHAETEGVEVLRRRGALCVAADLATESGTRELVRAVRESAQQNAARAGDQITSRNLDVRPTITVRPGWPLRAILRTDLVLRPWRG